MEHKEENKDSADAKGLLHSKGAKLSGADSKNNWGESSLESLDSLGSLDSHSKLSPLSVKPSRISEIVRTSSLSPVHEAPEHVPQIMSTPMPSRPNLGEVKPPLRHHHKALLPGSGASPNEKSAHSPSLGPIVSHNASANSPISAPQKSPVSPTFSPGPIVSPRIGSKASPSKEESISPNQSFTLGSPVPLNRKSKLDVPPLGEIAHSGRSNNSSHTSPATSERSALSPRMELGPLSSGRGIQSPRVPLGAIQSTLQPLGSARAPLGSLSSPQAPVPPAPEESRTSSLTERKSSLEDGKSSVDDNEVELVFESKADVAARKQAEAKSETTTETAIDPEVQPHRSEMHTINATETSLGSPEPVDSTDVFETPVVSVEVPVVRIVKASILAPPTIAEPAFVESMTEEHDIPKSVERLQQVPAVTTAEASRQEVTAVHAVVHEVVAPVAMNVPPLEIMQPMAMEYAEQSQVMHVEYAEQDEQGEHVPPLTMETSPQSPRQALGTPLAASYVKQNVDTTLHPIVETEETSESAGSERGTSEMDPTSADAVPEGHSVEIPPPNTPVRGSVGSKVSRFSRTPVGTGRSLLVAPLQLGEHPMLSSGKTRSPGGLALPSTPSSSHSPPSHSPVPGTPTLSPRSYTPSHASSSHTPSHGHFFKGRSTASLSVTGNSNSLDRLHAHPPVQPLAAHKYEMSYNKAASDLRAALLHLDADESNSKLMVRNIFRKLDVHENGELTAQELKNFVLSPELGLFEVDDPRALKYATLLMEQIDINGDGSVSMSELETFLWPPHMNTADHNATGPGIYSAASADFKEIGMILDFTRLAVRYHVSSVAALGSAEAILQEFAKLAKASLKRGCLDTKLVKKAFLNLKIPEFGRHLTAAEVDQLVVTLDCNDDGVVSAREFKDWLFPAHKQEDLNSLSNYLKKIIAEHFQGDVWHMYRFFCNGSDQLYKNDFGIVLKTIDSSISRHEAQALANRIAGNEKAITMARLLTVIGLVGRTTLTAADGFAIHCSGSVDPESTVNSSSMASGRSSKKNRKSGSRSGKKLSTHEEEADFNGSVDFGERDDNQELRVDEDGFDGGSLSDASELSCDSADLDAMDGLGVSDAAVRVNGAQAKNAVDINAPSEREKAIIRDMLFGAPSHSGSRSPTSKLNSSLQKTLQTHDVTGVEGTEQSGVRKTVGLAPNQLVALGFSEHLGRWRGFPYDNWSCCETNLLECPVISPRQSLTSPGSSPNRNRFSVDSDGSLYQRTKSPPFRPAGNSPVKAPALVVEEREPVVEVALVQRRRSPQRSPARLPAPASNMRSRWSPARLTSTGPSPSRSTPMVPSDKRMHKRTGSSAGFPAAQKKSAAPGRSASPARAPPRVHYKTFGGDKFKEAKKFKAPSSSHTATAASAPLVRSNHSSEIKSRAAAATQKTVAPKAQPGRSKVTATATKQHQPVQPLPAATQKPTTQAPTVLQQAPAIPIKEQPTEVDPTAASDQPPTLLTSVDMEVSTPTVEPPPIIPAPEQHVPVFASPTVTSTYQAPLQRPAVKGPPITAKFTVKVPAPAQPSVAPEVADLFDRLRQPAPLVEAQQIQLQPPKWSGETIHSKRGATTEEDTNGRRCSSLVANDISELVNAVSLAGSHAFEATLLSLHSELDTIRRQSSEQELSFSAMISENEQRLQTLRESLSVRRNNATESNPDNGEDSDSGGYDGEGGSYRSYQHLHVSGNSFSTRSARKARSHLRSGDVNHSAMSISLGSLDAPYLPNRAHSPNKYYRQSPHAQDFTKRSRSAPAHHSEGCKQNTSNSDSFFTGSVSKLVTYSSPNVGKSPKPRARSASPHRHFSFSSSHTSAQWGAGVSAGNAVPYHVARDKGIWVPSSPLHGASFNRTRQLSWRRKGPAVLAKSLQEAERRSRSPSPTAVVRDRSRERAPSPTRLPTRAETSDRVVVNGVEKLSPNHAIRTVDAPIRSTDIRTRRVASPSSSAQTKRNDASSKQRRASPQYSTESKQDSPYVEAGPAGKHHSPAYGVLPDHANPDRAEYSHLFESNQPAHPLVSPSPPAGMPYLSVPSFSAYAPTGFSKSPVPMQPSHYPPSPGYNSYPGAPSYVPVGVYPVAGYSTASFGSPMQLPGSPGMPGFASYVYPQQLQAFSSPGLSMTHSMGYMQGQVSTTSNDAWWCAIQAQKRQNEQAAFESELRARNILAVPGAPQSPVMPY